MIKLNDFVNKVFMEHDNKAKHDAEIRRKFMNTFPDLVVRETIKMLEKLDEDAMSHFSKYENGKLNISIEPTSIYQPTVVWNLTLTDELGLFIDDVYYKDDAVYKFLSKIDAEVNNKLTEELKKIIDGYQYVNAVLNSIYGLGCGNENSDDFISSLSLDITISKNR